jgi:mono/diheme cytochrome c family protein
MRRRLGATRLLLLVACFGPACSALPPVDLQRMIYQDRCTVWQRCPYLPGEQELQPPPEGTRPRSAPTGDPALIEGIAGGAYVEDVPLPLTRDLLRAGRDRYETFCAACHGLRGDGASIVAENMDLRRPPAIAGAAARSLPVGRVYRVIGHGYGLMRSYAEDLGTPEERWSVVAYLLALQESHGVPLDALPPEVRAEAERQLR